MDLIRKISTIAMLCIALVAGGLLAACGEQEEEGEPHAVEGERLELGPLLYNVQITRFLNPSNLDDRAYLEGLEPAPEGEEYLAVFMKVLNESDQPQPVASRMEVVNSRGQSFEPVETDNPFALDLDGSVVEPEGEIPAPDTPAASGPIKGSMVLFLIEQEATENRPLELEIHAPSGETGSVELDI